MFPRRIAPLLIATAISSIVVFPTLSPAQDAETPVASVENSRFQFEGVVNANAVYVRSGPSENDYPTTKLDRGSRVTVVGHRFNHLKILPPEGSFCYVAKVYVEKRGDGSIGRVVNNTINVRVGSSLNPMKTKVALKLEPNTDVRIVGEQDEYFKIAPPEGVYYYIAKQYVDPVRPVADATPAPASPEIPVRTPPAEQKAEGSAGEAQVVSIGDLMAREPADHTNAPTEARQPAPATPQPAEQHAASSEAGPPVASPGPDAASAGESVAQAVPSASENNPSARPAVPADAEFDRLESLFAEATGKPLDQQPLVELLSGYAGLVASEALPESMRRIAESRISVLKLRKDAVDQFAQMKLAQQKAQEERLAFAAEQKELESRLIKADFVSYTALGTVRVSSLQIGEKPLYRLTDPASGRTLVYLQSDDPSLGSMIGQFVGVRGSVVDDRQLNLRLIAPTAVEPVDLRKVNQGVVAQITPPSMLPTANVSQPGND
jgi:hypothetical protein